MARQSLETGPSAWEKFVLTALPRPFIWKKIDKITLKKNKYDPTVLNE